MNEDTICYDLEDTICYDFFIMNEKFTVEDYSEDSKALYNEDMFVTELATYDKEEAYSAAVEYLMKFKF